LLRFEHRDQRPDDRDRGKVLAAPLTLGVGELADEVLVDAANQIFAAVVLPEDVLGEQVNQTGDVLAAEIRAGVDSELPTYPYALVSGSWG
jgi:hypothetical protein